MHADGAGTKSALAYMYWKETGDLSVWKVRASLSRQQARPSILTLDLASTLLWKEFQASGSGRAYGAMRRRTRACSFATRIVASPRTQLTVAYAGTRSRAWTHTPTLPTSWRIHTPHRPMLSHSPLTTGSPVVQGIAMDAIIMNLDDLLCVGATDNILLSSTIGRNKNLVTGDVLPPPPPPPRPRLRLPWAVC